MAAVKIRELPKEDRPREKLLERGSGALTDRELLAILLRTGVKGANAVEVGGQLLKRHKTLSGLCRCSAEQLVGIHGIGPAKAVQLAAAFEHYNDVHPHSALQMLSPRMFRRSHVLTSVAECPEI